MSVKFEAAVNLLKGWLRKKVVEEKQITNCPVCGKKHSLQKRPLNAGMARVMVYFYEHNKVCGFNSMAWIDISKPKGVSDHLSHLFRAELLHNKADWNKLQHWGLVEIKPKEAPVPDEPVDLRKAGIWRLTQHGVDFVKGSREEWAYIRFDNGKPVTHSNLKIDILKALKTPFSLWDVLFG